MFEAITYDDMLCKLRSVPRKQFFFGIILTRPKSRYGDEILSNLNFLHHRSNQTLNFFLPGYGAYWNNSYVDQKDVIEIDHVKWSYSDKSFVEFIQDLESKSKFKYSGESTMLMIPFVNGSIIYSSSILIPLDKKLKDSSDTSFARLLEKVFRLAKSVGTTIELSDDFAYTELLETSMDEFFKSKTPIIYNIFNGQRYYAIRNLEK